MIGLGTIINTAAILVGGLGGALFGRFLSESAQETLTKVCGVSTLSDVERLASFDLYGAIIGKAYYIQAIDLEKAIEVAAK